jgi:hypothetical protein
LSDSFFPFLDLPITFLPPSAFPSICTRYVASARLLLCTDE